MNGNHSVSDESVQTDHQLSQINGLQDLTGRWLEASEVKHFIVLWTNSLNESKSLRRSTESTKEVKIGELKGAWKDLKERMNSTFDWAGGDDAFGSSSIPSRYNAGLVQIGTRYHHLL